MPEYYIRETFGKAPDDVFSRVGFSGDHSKTISLVQSGAYEIGATNFQVWESELAAEKIDLKEVQVIWKTPPYPDYQWTIRGDVDEKFGAGFKAKITQILLSMNDPDLLASFPRSGFIPATNADYEPIRSTAISLGLVD